MNYDLNDKQAAIALKFFEDLKSEIETAERNIFLCFRLEDFREEFLLTRGVEFQNYAHTHAAIKYSLNCFLDRLGNDGRGLNWTMGEATPAEDDTICRSRGREATYQRANAKRLEWVGEWIEYLKGI